LLYCLVASASPDELSPKQNRDTAVSIGSGERGKPPTNGICPELELAIWGGEQPNQTQRKEREKERKMTATVDTGTGWWWMVSLAGSAAGYLALSATAYFFVRLYQVRTHFRRTVKEYDIVSYPAHLMILAR
jgi:hypothetical protein